VRIIDSHVHFWRIGGPGQTWPDAGWPLLYRDFGPIDLLEAVATAAESAGGGSMLSGTASGASASGASVSSTSVAGASSASGAPLLGASASAIEVQSVILVQSQPDDRDTDWLLEVASELPRVAGVVGWVDLASPSAPARIAELASRPKLRGLRPMLQAIEDTQWLLRRELEPALQAMLQHGLRFDALIQPRHLQTLMEFARRWPKLPIVIDHGAKPRIALGEIEPWQAQTAELSLFPNVYCKLSGLRTEQAPGAPSAELVPYMQFLATSFQDRLMWGSDWPVLLHSGDRYADWLQTSVQLATQSEGVTLHCLFQEAASRFYGLD
jgi:L-fuconolactonase